MANKLTPDQRAARASDAFTARFADAVRRKEDHARNVTARVIIDPASPKKWGNIVWTYSPRSGVLLHVVAWMPGHLGADGNEFLHVGRCDRTHYSSGGHGADTEALAGARYRAPDGTVRTITTQDGAGDWQAQLERAGFIVARAV